MSAGDVVVTVDDAVVVLREAVVVAGTVTLVTEVVEVRERVEPPTILTLVEPLNLVVVQTDPLATDDAVPLSDATPLALGAAAPGTAAEASRADHVHPAVHHTYVQAIASTVWLFTHNLNGRPALVVQDDVGNVIYGDVRYPSVMTAMVLFAVPLRGRIDAIGL